MRMLLTRRDALTCDLDSTVTALEWSCASRTMARAWFGLAPSPGGSNGLEEAYTRDGGSVGGESRVPRRSSSRHGWASSRRHCGFWLSSL